MLNANFVAETTFPSNVQIEIVILVCLFPFFSSKFFSQIIHSHTNSPTRFRSSGPASTTSHNKQFAFLFSATLLIHLSIRLLILAHFVIRLTDFPENEEIDEYELSAALQGFNYLNYYTNSRISYGTGAQQWYANVYFEKREDALQLLNHDRVLYKNSLLTRQWSRNDQIREKDLAKQERKKIMTL